MTEAELLRLDTLIYGNCYVDMKTGKRVDPTSSFIDAQPLRASRPTASGIESEVLEATEGQPAGTRIAIVEAVMAKYAEHVERWEYAATAYGWRFDVALTPFPKYVPFDTETSEDVHTPLVTMKGGDLSYKQIEALEACKTVWQNVIAEHEENGARVVHDEILSEAPTLEVRTESEIWSAQVSAKLRARAAAPENNLTRHFGYEGDD